MDLIHVASGKTIYKIDDGAGTALLLAMPEAFKRTEPKPAHSIHPAAPRWAVNANNYLDRPQIMLTRPNGETTYYPGPDVDQWTASAAHAAKVFEAIKLSCPKEILDQYEDARLLKQKQNVAAAQNYNRVRTT
jgi:hypothetical protein